MGVCARANFITMFKTRFVYAVLVTSSNNSSALSDNLDDEMLQVVNLPDRRLSGLLIIIHGNNLFLCENAMR